MVIIFVVAVVEGIQCIIVFVAGHDLVSIEFVAHDEIISVGIVELISVVIIQEPVGIAVDASAVVVGRDVRDAAVTRKAMVGTVVVV